MSNERQDVPLDHVAEELDAMRAVHAALLPLSRSGRVRVLDWVRQALNTTVGGVRGSDQADALFKDRADRCRSVLEADGRRVQ